MDEIQRALKEAHPDDLPAIRKYVAWIRFRRMVQNAFYFRAHWLAPRRAEMPPVVEYHWVR